MLESFELSALLISLFTGLLLGIPVGPTMFLIVDASMQVGKKAGFKVYCGFMAAKLLYMSVALLANSFITSNKSLESAFYLVASSMLVVWGVIIFFKSVKKKEAIKPSESGLLFKRGLMVGLSNPVIPFIYLTFIQFIKLHSTEATTITYLVHIFIMEAVTLLVLASIIALLLKGGAFIENHWNKVVKAMGVVLICAGAYQVYEMINLNDGEIEISNDKNVLEEQLEQIEK